MRTKRTEADMDEFLLKLGLWRKPIARDGYSLFRAVSEQVRFADINFFLLDRKV